MGRLDDVLRHLAQALVAVHRSGAQDLEGAVVADLARAHEDAFGALHGLALLEAGGHVAQLFEQGLLAFEARLRELHERAQALRAVAADHVGVHARLGGLHDVRGIAIVGEHQHRQRRHLGQGLRGLEQGIVGRGGLHHHQTWCMAHHALHQLAASLHHRQHLGARGLQVVHQRLAGRPITQQNHRNMHMNQRLG